MIPKKRTGIPEYSRKQNLLDKLASMRDYSMENPELQDVAKTHFKKKNIEQISNLNKEKIDLQKELKDLQTEQSDILFSVDYMKMQIEKSQNLQSDLKRTLFDLDMLKKKRVIFDNYRKNLKVVLKRFFNVGGLSNRTLILPLKNTINEQDIVKINKGADKISNIKEVLHMNREVVVQANDEEIIKYLKDNGYGFRDEKKDFYEAKAYNKNNVKVDLTEEFKKIKDSVKNLDSKKNILAKIDPKLEQYNVIAADIKRISEFKTSFLSRMEIIKNQTDDLDNIDNIDVIILSWIPRHIMSQSTGTIWRSCMSYQQEQEGDVGINIRYVGTGIEDGTFIAWLVKIKDLKSIKEPKARILIKPFVNENGDTIWWPSHIYHDGSLTGGESILFKRILKNYCYIKQKKYVLGSLSIADDDRVYEDESDEMIEDEDNFEEDRFAEEGLQEKHINTNTFETQIEKTPNNFYRIFYSIGFTNKKMFDFLESRNANYFNEDVIVNLFKMSYLSNNLFFLQYALDKGLEIKVSIYQLYVERINNIIINGQYNEKALNIFLNFVRKNKNVQVGVHGDLDLHVFPRLYSKQLMKNQHMKVDNKLLDFILKHDDVMNNIINIDSHVEITILKYSVFSKEQRKEINKYLKKFLSERKRISPDILAKIQILIDTFRDENKNIFDEMQKLIDEKKIVFDSEYLTFFCTKNYDDSFFSDDVLKKLIIIYGKSKRKENNLFSKIESKATVFEKMFKDNIASAYIQTLDGDKKRISKTLIEEAKKLGIINGKNLLYSDFNYKIAFDKELLIQFLEKDNIHSDKVIQFFNSFTGYTERIDISDLMLYIDEKLPNIKLFANPKIFDVFKIFDHDQVGEFGRITNIRNPELFVINNEVTKRLLAHQSENLVMYKYLIMMFFYKENIEKNMKIFENIFKGKKLTNYNSINDTHLISLIITGYIIKPEIMEKILTYLDEEFVYNSISKIDIDFGYANGLLSNKAFTEYLYRDYFLDKFKKSEKMIKFFFQALVSGIPRSTKNENYLTSMNSHYNNLKTKNKKFIDFVGELIKDQKDLDFVFSKEMLDKINGVKPRAGIETLSLSAAQLANMHRQRNIHTQPIDIDFVELMQIVSIMFILIKYYNFDKKLIENSKIMQYYNLLLEKHKKHKANMSDDSFEKTIDNLFPIVNKLLA